ncbi:MAG: Wzz/FepE/Etk N-terminal domain-containing protein [Anaerolineae bacterium]|nr:Wzz/FepE/Etk N-terminal domain-containing protein [Anaerolineae bacterium]
MQLSDYVRILARRGWLIVLAVAITAGSAFVFSRLQTPIYRATQKILIQPARNDFGLAQTLKQLMSSWATRLDADERADDVIRALNLDMTPAQLRSMVTISTNLDTLLINIDVDMPDMEIAGRVARTYGEQFVQWRNQSNAPIRLEDRINAELIDQPAISLFRPNTAFNVAAGALLGILIGGGAVFVLEYLSANVVRRREDVERALNLPVLGALPSAE